MKSKKHRHELIRTGTETLTIKKEIKMQVTLRILETHQQYFDKLEGMAITANSYQECNTMNKKLNEILRFYIVEVPKLKAENDRIRKEFREYRDKSEKLQNAIMQQIKWTKIVTELTANETEKESVSDFIDTVKNHLGNDDEDDFDDDDENDFQDDDEDDDDL